MKRIVVLVVVASLLMITPVSAGMKTHWLRASGKYYAPWAMSGKKVFKEQLKYSSLSKKQKKEAMRLFNHDPRKLYKKYRKKIGLHPVFKTKLKGNTLTLWGKLTYKGNGIKKKYKFGKYKFKITNSTYTKYGYQGEYGAKYIVQRGAKMRKELRNPYGLTYWLYVSGGKIYKIESSS